MLTRSQKRRITDGYENLALSTLAQLPWQIETRKTEKPAEQELITVGPIEDTQLIKKTSKSKQK